MARRETAAAEAIRKEEQAPAPAPVEQKAEAPAPAPETPVEPADAPTVLSELYGENNLMQSSYKFPENPRTRVMETQSPVAAVYGALGSDTSFRAFVGSAVRHTLSESLAKAYRSLLRKNIPELRTNLNNSLSTFLARKPWKDVSLPSAP